MSIIQWFPRRRRTILVPGLRVHRGTGDVVCQGYDRPTHVCRFVYLVGSHAYCWGCLLDFGADHPQGGDIHQEAA